MSYISNMFYTWRFGWSKSGLPSATWVMLFWGETSGKPCTMMAQDLGYPLVNKHGYGKWPFIVDLPIKKSDFP